MTLKIPVRSLWKNKWRNGSPFRVLRYYSLRVSHPLSSLKRRMRSPKLSDLSQDQQERLRLLQKEGCAPAGNDLDQGMLTEICTAIHHRAQEVSYEMEAGKGKNFWERMLTSDDRVSSSLYVRFALQPSVLAMVSTYIGEIPYLAQIDAFYSHPTKNETWQESQLWHRDYDDRKMCKLFVYCSDVRGPADGEFTYIPKQVSNNVRNQFFPKRVSDEEMTRQGLLQEKKAVTGPTGTAFYIDTGTCYHLGSRVDPDHKRLAFTALYMTHASLWPYDNGVQIVHSLNKTEQLLLRC